MNILVLGSGGREHALAWALARTERVYIAPGNAGTEAVGTNLALDPEDASQVGAAVAEYGIDLVVVGPEGPLVAGLVDKLKDQVAIIGPGREAAQLEGSKAFSKAFMAEQGIFHAAYAEFDASQLAEAEAYIRAQPHRLVVKADGLAAGKGVIVAQDQAEALAAVRSILAEGTFGTAGSRVVIEQYLDGIEMSVFVLTDGQHYRLLPNAKDYKRIGEGDTGPNTGGMGSVSPVPFADATLEEKIRTRIVEPTVAGIQARGWHYRGFVFIGLMIVDGEPYVLEYNVRLGDPETQSVLARLRTPLARLLQACWQQRLDQTPLEADPRAAVTVVLASQGYPGSYPTGLPIAGLDGPGIPDTQIFHAGTRRGAAGTLTAGGRVLAVTSLADTLQDAQARALQAAAQLSYQGRYYRTDIAADLLKLQA